MKLLTQSETAKAIELYNGGLTFREIAFRLKCAPETVVRSMQKFVVRV